MVEKPIHEEPEESPTEVGVPPQDPDNVNQVLAQVLHQLDRHEIVDREALIEEYPTLRAELDSYFQLADKLDELLDKPLPMDSEPACLEIPGFKIERLLRRGGMGLVYLAHQKALDRQVALKVLPRSFLAEPELLQRFRLEATIAARILDSHILPIHDIVIHDEQPVLVMPYVQGGDLGQIIRQRLDLKQGQSEADEVHPWASLEDRLFTEKMLGVLDQMVQAIAAIHQVGILHRDIKPSNILVDQRGNAWLSDFGLARLTQHGSDITSAGAIIGTPGFISPEQYSGATDIDERADVFAAGVTLYNALTLELPYREARVDVGSDLPNRPSVINGAIDDAIDTVVVKALAPRRNDRYRTGERLRVDWERSRNGLPPHGRAPWRPVHRRIAWLGLAAVALVTLAGGLWWGKLLGSAGASTTKQDESSVVAGDGSSVLPVSEDSRSTTDSAATKGVGRLRVNLPTIPVAKRGVLVPVDPQSGVLDSQRKIRLRPVGERLEADQVPPATYLVVVELAGHGFHEVYRTVPSRQQRQDSPAAFRHTRWRFDEDDTALVHLPKIEIPQNADAIQGMALLRGDPEFQAGDDAFDVKAVGSHPRPITDFYIDANEVSALDYQRLATEHGTLQVSSNANHAAEGVAWISFDQALYYAELVGKRLPSEFEFEFAATNGGTTRFPWGNDSQRLDAEYFGPTIAPYDITEGGWRVAGLFSGRAEWTDSWATPYPVASASALAVFRSIPEFDTYRVVRGGSSELVKDGVLESLGETLNRGPRWRQSFKRHDRHPGLGFRCARSIAPRFLE